MALDTKTKRLSILNFGAPFYVTLPESDGSFDVGDRSAFLHLSSTFGGAAYTPLPFGTVAMDLDFNNYTTAITVSRTTSLAEDTRTMDLSKG
jgi:hypothetical protein